MRVLALTVSLLMGVAPSAALAQSKAHHGDVSLTYQWVHTNTQPGQCGCFGLNGGSLTASLNVSSQLAGVLDFSGGYQGSGPSTGNTLTLVSYMAGGRYYVRSMQQSARHAVRPFAQALLGGAHAGGGIAGAGDGTYAFALRAGAGLDVPLGRKLSLRAVQADYYLTHFANTYNNRQNNLLLGAGIAYRF